MPRLVLTPLIALALLLGSGLPAHATELELANAAFEQWKDGLPVGWSKSIGARRDPGDTPGRVVQLGKDGVALVGDAKTNEWPLLSQRVTASSGAFLELQYTARVLGAKREPGQFGSCYVGFILRDVDGKPAGFTVSNVTSTDWSDGAVRLKLPAGTANVDVAFFLSQTGRLEVARMRLRERPASESFDILVSEMDRHYPFFAMHGIDWQQVGHRHRAAATKATTAEEFVAAIQPMLAELKDGHVWIEAPGGTKTWTWTPKVHTNFELQPLLGRLQDVKQVIRNVISATTPEGYGYLAIGTMQLTPAQYGAIESAFKAHFVRPGIVLDLRVNGGGAEVWGQRLCSLLTKEQVLYGRSKLRGGPKHDNLIAGGVRHVTPAKAGHYEGPVVALIGPGCVSSGEGMAMMLKAIPGIPLVGLPTRGSSGNPQPVHLPNDVRVWFSRWISLLPDGSGIERTGVAPDVRIEHLTGKDPALDEAVKILKAKAGKR